MYYFLKLNFPESLVREHVYSYRHNIFRLTKGRDASQDLLIIVPDT